MEETKEIKKIDTRYLTILSVMSCLAVVILHVNGDAFWNFSGNLSWTSANLIESLFYFAVPIFFMISGATLIDYRQRYDTKTYVKKRIFKTLIPFLVWSLISLVIGLIDGCYNLNDLSVHFFIDGIINTKFQSVYWFFIPLFVCYAMIVVLSLIPDESKQKVFTFLIVAGLITISVLPLLFNLFGWNYNQGLYIPFTGGGYLIFVLLGYCINKHDLKLRYRIVIYCLGILGLLIHLLGTQFSSIRSGWIIQTYKGYTNAPSVLYAVAIFTFFRYCKPNKFFNFMYRVCKFMAPMTFGIYLIHPLILNHINKLFDVNDICFRTFGSIAIFILCASIVWIIQHIPYIKKLIQR